jgi:hypothetical protein
MVGVSVEVVGCVVCFTCLLLVLVSVREGFVGGVAGFWWGVGCGSFADGSVR